MKSCKIPKDTYIQGCVHHNVTADQNNYSSFTNSMKLYYFLNALKLKFFNFQTERDVSVRQRAVDLLYAMCDKNNAEEIVSEMLTYLETADYSIKEEMVINGHHGNIIVSVGW